ncbi:O-methyltransferase [Saccharopolyspora sp. CA-218241]|uniref:O-methyltransferase n=1 Tax=Saccharopolyspora sp. CA-218241 TaxID=3240027 RepID=UPI003D982E08
MHQEQWTAVDTYIAERLAPADQARDAALRTAAESGLPPIAVSAAQGKLLQVLATSVGARSILEIGTLAGYSAMWLGRALPPGGRMTTVEADPVHAEVARGNLTRAGLAEVVDVRVGRALDVLPELSGPFDFTFIDADKATIPEYVRWALALSRPGALIVVDNVVRGGALADADSTDEAVAGVRRLHDLLAEEPGLLATTVQTVGAKGYDGFTLALVLPADR